MYKAYGKRILDILFVLLFFPVICLAAIFIVPLIFLEDGGPILYRASRVGKNGKVFLMYKFRSMSKNAPDWRNPDGSSYTGEDDPRVTKVGKVLRKTSVDELPQFFNVLKGDMSLVGPRPDLVTVPFAKMGINEQKRLRVLPGITGYNQATMRNVASMAEKHLQDVYYVDHLSLKLDLTIIIKTIVSVLQRKNVYGELDNRSANMP